jgi:integrase
MGSTVTWEQIEPGIYRREGRDGKAIYRAVRQAGKREDGGYAQQVRTFNGSKIANALKQARLWRSMGAVAVAKGEELVSEAAAMTLRQAFEAFLADPDANIASKTAKVYGDYFRALERADDRLPGMRLRDITRTRLRAALERVNGRTMREKARTLVHGVYRFHEVEPNPAAAKRRRRTRSNKLAAASTKLEGQYLSDGAVERILAALPEEYRGYVRLMWRSGLRPQEAAALRVGSFNPETNVLSIDHVVSDGKIVEGTKTGVGRHPVLPASVAQMLTDHIRRFSDLTDPSALVFTTPGGTMVNELHFSRREWRKACEAAGVTARPYALRHTYTTNAVHAGCDLATIAEMSGHSVSVLASVYLHYDESAGRRAAEKLDELYRGEEVSVA